METKYLLPNKFKNLGWFTLIISIVIWIYSALIIKDDISFLRANVFAVIGSEFMRGGTKYFNFINSNITYTLIGVLFIIGGLLVAFSKEKIEDEFIAKLRLQSFQWSFLINYVLLFLLFLFVYGMEFLSVLIYNMFTMLILFIIRFHYLLFKYRS